MNEAEKKDRGLILSHIERLRGQENATVVDDGERVRITVTSQKTGITLSRYLDREAFLDLYYVWAVLNVLIEELRKLEEDHQIQVDNEIERLKTVPSRSRKPRQR